MFAARGGAAVPQREADGAKQAEERAPPYGQPKVLDCEACVVPGRV